MYLHYYFKGNYAKQDIFKEIISMWATKMHNYKCKIQTPTSDYGKTIFIYLKANLNVLH